MNKKFQQQWYSLGEGSEKLGYARGYLSQWLRRYEGEIPEGVIYKTRNSKLINDEGLKWIKKQTKKKDVLVNNSLFTRINT
ncbi:MAG: hypothetical protein L0I95_06350 [Tetragenococcus koreensis]|uniref:Transposase n=1 Tax=Tetragenococcus halophilus TaxID=51669 RepID=A0AB35HRP4_TETHA|nr:hypothetical protein [Tetragenococcus halophilus]MDN6139363.1 hypothetical protein [Tetragenococcus koreensis]MDN6195148.1 hypothetical protein [Atopostipes suicloacalis]MDN6836082.1 hypothetical protein [Lactococcus lactis]MCO8296236.1 hypothetical protein [Tetragenococcus halophilus]MCO8298781.1 hypothetical protein [Tetragenococcus halophilus]